jgi:hypothetical protein
MAVIPSVLHRQYEPQHYAGNGVLHAMSQMKPASSRARAASIANTLSVMVLQMLCAEPGS